MQQSMLDFAEKVEPNSRLSWIKVSEMLEGLSSPIMGRPSSRLSPRSPIRSSWISPSIRAHGAREHRPMPWHRDGRTVRWVQFRVGQENVQPPILVVRQIDEGFEIAALANIRRPTGARPPKLGAWPPTF